jgi:pyridine nucleotide-disulfide oxidoreductase family protein
MKQLVLAGAGHAHALVLLDLVRRPLRHTAVTVISPHALAPYSGMVPGWLAGRYRFDEIGIRFPQLAAAAGATWLQGEVDALDAKQRRLRLAEGRELSFDVLSLNVGSTLRPPEDAGDRVLPMRPLAELHTRWERTLAEWSAAKGHAPLVVSAVGGGVAGFESLLAVLARLRATRPDRVVQGHLFARAATLLPELSAPARRAAQRALGAAGVQLHAGQAWQQSADPGSDLLLWATGAQALAWQLDPLRRGALAVDAAGFVRIDATLRSLSHPQVFAAGDCASFEGGGLPKAGVFAVRMGPVLAANLRAAIEGAAPLRVYRPQRQHLVLLATADGRAIASRGPLGAEGRWVWRWKDRIDRSFVGRFALGAPGESPGAR